MLDGVQNSLNKLFHLIEKTEAQRGGVPFLESHGLEVIELIKCLVVVLGGCVKASSARLRGIGCQA